MPKQAVQNSSHAGFIDAGFVGHITLEIKNDSEDQWLVLRVGSKIGQLVFYTCNPPEKAYDQTGRYQNQGDTAGSKGIDG